MLSRNKAVASGHFSADQGRINQHIGAQLGQIRGALDKKYGGFTQADAAEVIGTTREMISHFERGRNNIFAAYLVQLAHWMNVPLDYFDTAAEPDPFLAEAATLLRRISPERRALALAMLQNLQEVG